MRTERWAAHHPCEAHGEETQSRLEDAQQLSANL
jgi:hypothetical protein